MVALDGLLNLCAWLLRSECTHRGANSAGGRFPGAPHLAPRVILKGFLVCLCRVGGAEAAGMR